MDEGSGNSRHRDNPADDSRRDSNFTKHQAAKKSQPKTDLRSPDTSERIIEAIASKGEVDKNDEKPAAATSEVTTAIA